MRTRTKYYLISFVFFALYLITYSVLFNIIELHYISRVLLFGLVYFCVIECLLKSILHQEHSFKFVYVYYFSSIGYMIMYSIFFNVNNDFFGFADDIFYMEYAKRLIDISYTTNYGNVVRLLFQLTNSLNIIRLINLISFTGLIRIVVYVTRNHKSNLRNIILFIFASFSLSSLISQFYVRDIMYSLLLIIVVMKVKESNLKVHELILILLLTSILEYLRSFSGVIVLLGAILYFLRSYFRNRKILFSITMFLITLVFYFTYIDEVIPVLLRYVRWNDRVLSDSLISRRLLINSIFDIYKIPLQIIYNLAIPFNDVSTRFAFESIANVFKMMYFPILFSGLILLLRNFKKYRVYSYILLPLYLSIVVFNFSNVRQTIFIESVLFIVFISEFCDKRTKSNLTLTLFVLYFAHIILNIVLLLR